MTKKYKIIATLMAIVIVALAISLTAVLICSMSNDNLEQTAPDNSFIANGGESSGISLVMAKSNENAIANTTYTITATVNPSDAVNQKLNWSMSWKTPTSEWAKDKQTRDYVGITLDQSTKIATVNCKQPFGEQIIVKSVAEENADIFATCTLDYAQKLTNANLNIGNIAVNLGGNTNVKYEIAKGVNGPGGTISANMTTSEVYSLAETFTKSVKISYVTVGESSKYFAMKGSTITGASKNNDTEYLGKEMYFDYDHDIYNWFIAQRNGDIKFREMTTAEIASYFSDITQPILHKITLTITGKYNTYTYTSTIMCNGYTNNTRVNSVTIGDGGYIF